MTIIVKIKLDGEFKTYNYEGDLNIPVTTLLDELDIDYSCSCLQGLCGSCAMVINSQPKLACKAFLNREIMIKEYKTITIEPLSKFPIINGLKVDKSILHDKLIQSKLWLEGDAQISDETDFEYEMSLCLMCGCCVEACPNYDGGNFHGTPVAVSSAKLMTLEADETHLSEIKKDYKDNFYSHCVKSLVCEDICPMEIETQRAISKMNKKSVWKIRQILGR